MQIIHNCQEKAEDYLYFLRDQCRRQMYWKVPAGAILSMLLMINSAVFAQDPAQSGNVEAAPQSSNVDCSDPLSSASSECAYDEHQKNSISQAPQSVSSPSAQFSGEGPPLNGEYSDGENLTGRAGTFDRNRKIAPLPEPLTEFQKFVASTTGQVLPIFGADLFRHVPSTFSPLNLAPVPLDYVLGPGDELRIRVWGQVNFQANLRVDRSGDIFLPQIGPVHVEGLPVSDLDAKLRDAISHAYHNFNLTADVGQTRAIQVYVTGAARRPGVYTVSSLSTLVDALFTSGGPSIQGSMRNIQLLRENKVITNFDLYALIAHGDKSKDVKLLPGDVIYIPPVSARVALIGSVRNPGVYELRAHQSLQDLLTDGGGVSTVASGARISIERIDDHRFRSAMEVAYDATGLATPLADGDIVRIFSIVPEYRKTIILRGNTANPGRFAWFPGMRISDLIPDKDSLITRNYWWRRAQLGLPAPEFEPMPSLANMRQPAENHPVTINPESEMSYPHSTPYRAQTAINESGQGTQQESQETNQEYPTGLNQDQIPGARQQYASASRQGASSTSLAGAQSSLVTRATSPSQRTSIKLLAPEIDWGYAAIERLNPDTLQTSVIPFDLGKAVLQHDASQNLQLQPGDVVTIFSDADIKVPLAQQTKLVRLEGEFVHAGVYTAEPGETLRHLVERAGGLTPNAYLYGSEFTRQSTREVQQARIDEYVQNLSMKMERSALALASSSTASAQDLASGAAAQSSERELLAGLRQVRAAGRIVLQFNPGATGPGGLPSLPLENGDRFNVPSVPAVVNVVGAVYDQNSFLYKLPLRAEDYLRQAGGPTRDADRRHEFIIRADGEVVSRDTLKSVWGDEFGKLRINPGDTIVVPEKTFKPSALRGLIDWSQVFSQLALGAAAVNVIR